LTTLAKLRGGWGVKDSPNYLFEKEKEKEKKEKNEEH
jgi:hypothetical protein